MPRMRQRDATACVDTLSAVDPWQTAYPPMTFTDQLSADMQRFLRDTGLLDKLSNRVPNYGGSQMVTRAFDGSNYTDPMPTVDDVRRMRDIGIRVAIIQAVQPPNGYPHAGEDPPYTVRLAQVCAEGGLTVDGYVYGFFQSNGESPAERFTRLTRMFTDAGITVRRWWADWEDRQTGVSFSPAMRRQVVIDAQRALLQAGGKLAPGVYWAQWVIDDLLGGSEACADMLRQLDDMTSQVYSESVPTWGANWNGAQDASDTVLAGRPVAVKQYQGSTSLAGIAGVDPDVLSDAEAATLDSDETSSSGDQYASVYSVPMVPDTYQSKFTLRGRYDWEGVVANLEGIIDMLTTQVADAQRATHGQDRTELHDALDKMAGILRDHGYDVAQVDSMPDETTQAVP